MNNVYIGDVFEFVRNGASIKQSENASGIPVTRIETIWNSTIDSERFGYANIIDASEYENYLLKDGDILMSHINSPKHLGKCACYQNKPDKLIHAMNLLNLRPNSDFISSKFIYYFFNTPKFKGMINKISNQSVNQASFSAGNLKKLQVPLPPLAEQKQIAAILDAADSLRQKDQQLVEHYTAFSQSLFLEMFGDPVTNPLDWNTKLLDEITDFITSGSRGWAKYYSDTGDLFLRIQNVGENRLSLDEIAYVKAPNTTEAKRTTVKAGDILLSITADLGRTAVIPEGLPKAHINQHLAIIRLKSGFVPFYVSEYISSIGGRRQLNQSNKGGVKAGLNFNDIKALKIPIPPIELQNQFAERIAIIEKQKQQAQANLKKSEALFNSLLQRAFTGELTADKAA
ncbi:MULTISPECIES: restriction endonuclease subunit S [unclassified Methylophaga]|uniref:restriction endonuclease subunit S n=1 Tax=unclassified Methylophaga TaxID=2629249 RepID=UPI000C924518|nr:MULTISPECIES: restriction endonuclease subunit S [unclassified Methylophaga]MBN45280.1 hypothetical protein [Methylophaga sp.]